MMKSIFQAVLCLSLATLCRAGGCDPSPCGSDQACFQDPQDSTAPPLCMDLGYRPGNCSTNVVHCHDHARCIDSSDMTSYTCTCDGEGVTGDGFKDGTGCKLSFRPCQHENDCPQYGYCDTQRKVCECLPNFQGDGNTCEDINECLEKPCDPNAICSNYDGGFDCTCDVENNYNGDGFTCRLFCYTNQDCANNAKCNATNNCECEPGYRGDGMVACRDIDECAENLDTECSEHATCRNTPGGYDCKCINGYAGDGKTCTPLPTRCDFAVGRRHKRYYLIDPDFTGPANAFWVRCLWLGTKHWATTVIPRGNFPVAAPENNQDLEIDYDPKPEDIKALIDNSPFCSQKFSFSCSPGFKLFPGTTWYDVNDTPHNNWGSSMDQMCTCGELKRCEKSCYCDGTQTDERTMDEARVVDKSQLPLVRIHFSQSQKDKGRVEVEPLMCSNKPIDIPKDCHEAKFVNGIQENTPMFIDVDGPENGEDPFLVFCDMESYEHVGITQISTNNGNPVQVTTEEGETIEYTVDHGKMKALIEGSLFCSQRVEFQCQNSKLGGADGGAVYVRGDTQRLGYFPGAHGKADSCACGATQSCDDPNVMCNCNIDDGQEHKDFGLIINKSDLPVTKVTAQIGGSRSSTYEIGELKCSQKQFEIEPNCEKLHAIGVRESYTYFIDGDGTGGQDPFPVHCIFVEDPAQGQTIVHHDKEGPMTVDSTDVDITYLMANPGQINALLERSTFCTQDIAIDCKQFNVPVDPGSILWTGGSAGPTGSLKLSDYLDSCGPNGDACKCSQNGDDSGVIVDKSVLPMNKLDFSSVQNLNTAGPITVDVGPLVCSEVFPTCKQLYEFMDSEKALDGEATVVNGFFTTDPDGAGGVPPFTVECTFPETVFEVDTGKGEIGPDPNDPLEPVSKCFNINYSSATNHPVSPAQVAAYVASSTSCSQSLSLKCRKTPATKMVNFTTCDGVTQVGWAGSYGQDSCACGVNGNCDGGRDALCNCDRAGNKEREDSGVITQKNRLPVCQICMRIDPPSDGSGWPSPLPQLKYELGELVCDRPKKGLGSCQEARRGAKVGGQVGETMAALDSPTGPPVPIGCKLYRNPPVGILTVKPKDPSYPPPEDDKPTDITINYITINITVVGQVMSQQKYCSQKVFLYCAGADTGTLSDNYGWYDRYGNLNQEWEMMSPDREELEQNCASNPKLCTKCGNPQGFLIKDKDLLPVTRLVLAGSNIGVVVDNTECFDLRTSCQELYDMKDRKSGAFGKNRYVIDVDRAGLLRPFRVLCEFDKYNDNGVTVVEVGGEWESSDPIVWQDDDSEDFDLEVEYEHATPEQINGLTTISEFCWQSVQFKCENFPLLVDPTQPSTYYRLYDGQPATSFGTGEDVNFQGCACHQLDVCYTAMPCNCDAEGPASVDQGAITDRASLPVTGVRVAGRNDSNAVAQFKIGNVRCSARSTALPKDCAEALKFVSKDGIDYRRTGEYLISPNPDVVKPFMVRCDFTTFDGVGVTVIRPHFPEENPLPTNSSDTPTDVPYNGVDKDQIKELVAQSAYCYQGVRFDCFKTALLAGGSYFHSTNMTTKWTFWGGGQPGQGDSAGTCACGDDESCAGIDSSQGQRSRSCNCDLADAEYRKDAGVIDTKAALPVTMFQLGAVTDMSEAKLTVGDLYCAQEPLNLNECELGFHDCDPQATCVDTKDGYDCLCPEGYQGKGVVTDSSHATANGRVCIDDDECEALNPCSYYAYCHNLPGSYNCTCKEGFKASSDTDCVDVDECAEGTDDCGENAFCDNLIGSYRCICNKGFRGDGKTCVPVGQCSCFGDPHCVSFDDQWLHYQGDCSYVMATDGCDGNTGTFEVQVEMWRKDQDPTTFKYSWVKSVTVLVEGKTIRLEQGPRLVVDGQVVSNYVESFKLRVTQINNRIKLSTFDGLEVTWDGSDRVSVIVPHGVRSKTCGLCGNYDGDPSNDWVVGPACPALAGQQTDNYDLFGRSWTVDGECDPRCEDTDPPQEPPEECEHESKAEVDRECSELTDPATSVFKECLSTRSPQSLEDLTFSCNFDVCASSEELNAKLCRFAETIAKECAETDKITIKNWRGSVDTCEEVTCPSGTEYSPCGPANPPTCLSSDDSVSEACVEGCFCPDGLLTEGDRCITQEQCGCYHGGNYIATGEKLILSGCTAEIQCEGLNQTSSEPVECGVNEECRADGGVTDCYCQSGFIKINGTCEDESCVGVQCGDNMECVNGTCECINGFQGECGKCVDIDECETHLHTCNRRGEKCVNLPGTYRCDCQPGYASDGNRCKDVNECEVLTNTCGDNSECVNTPGGYVCECCAGYKHSPNGHCVRDTDKDTASGGRCCACQGERCTKPGKVCGTDGTTYPSYRALSTHACKTQDQTLRLNYKGQCEASCNDIVCERNYQQCMEDSNGVPQCKCSNCANSSNNDEVCGSNGVTYPGVCSLKKAACEDDYQDMVRVKSQGPCQGDGQS